MTETLRNDAMDSRIQSLEPLLDYKGTLGYAAAYNKRKLVQEATEYLIRKDELIKKYGTQDGESYSINPSMDAWKDFEAELLPLAQIEHEIDLMQVDVSEAKELTGRQMIDNWWMFKEESDA